jgi:hypothetical protein
MRSWTGAPTGSPGTCGDIGVARRERSRRGVPAGPRRTSWSPPWPSLKAGGAYVPLDPDLPDGRLQALARRRTPRRRARHTGQSLLERFREPVLSVVVARPRLQDNDRAACRMNLPTHRCPDDLAYIIYTSGSSGRAQRGARRAPARSSTRCPLAPGRLPPVDRGRRSCCSAPRWASTRRVWELFGTLSIRRAASGPTAGGRASTPAGSCACSADEHDHDSCRWSHPCSTCPARAAGIGDLPRRCAGCCAAASRSSPDLADACLARYCPPSCTTSTGPRRQRSTPPTGY